MWKVELDESQAEIKITGTNTKNLRYVNSTTLTAECEEELKSLLMRWKKRVKILTWNNIHKTKIMASGLYHFMANGEKVEAVKDFIFFGSKITADGACIQEIKRCLLLGEKSMTNLYNVLKKQRHQFANKGPHSQSYGFF